MDKVVKGLLGLMVVWLVSSLVFVIVSHPGAVPLPVAGANNSPSNSPALSVAIPTVTPIPGKAKTLSPELVHLWLAGIPVTVYTPASSSGKTNILLALHGMGGTGDAIYRGLASFAAEHKLALLAPTFNYNFNWKDPKIVASEDVTLALKLNQIVAEFEAQTPQLKFARQVMLYGFSRGAQLASRYALLYPENTLAVAVLSAGSYTLPETVYNKQSLPFPYGVSDLQKYTGQPFDQTDFEKVHFCLEVGALDNSPSQTPRAWDIYLGQTRLQRSESFYEALQKEGNPVQHTVFPGTGHQETAAMRQIALNYFQKLLTAN